jgi:mersacidin/lichenicidin family type 2 lantibiotic
MDKNLVRAWKDPRFREASPVSAEHPAGLIELADEDLRESGTAGGAPITTAITCTEYTWRGWKACCP